MSTTFQQALSVAEVECRSGSTNQRKESVADSWSAEDASSPHGAMGQYTLVNGDVDQLYGSNGYAVDAQTGAITFDKNQGLVIGYAHIFSGKLRGNIATGFNRGKTAQASENRTLEEAFLNLIYSPVKDVDLGGEWIYGSRRTFRDGTGIRPDGSLQLLTAGLRTRRSALASIDRAVRHDATRKT